MNDNDGQKGEKQSLSASNETNTCPCEEYIDDAVFIQCDCCDTWWHCSCVSLKGLTETMVAVIEHYECPRCFKSPLASMEESPIQGELGTVCNVLTNTMKKEFKAVTTVFQNTLKEELVSALEMTKKDIVNESSTKVKSYVEAVKVDLQTVVKETPPARLVKDAVRQMDTDQIERVKRECNVVINQVPEKIVNGKHDKENDLKFLYQTCGFEENEVVSCFRAGKVTKLDSSKDGITPRPRPLVVKLKTKEDAMWWCDYGNGWKVESDNSDEPEKKAVYWINQDLNRADREAQFFVRQERRNRLKRKAAATPKKENE